MADNGLIAAYLMVGADELKREFLVNRLTERVAKLGDIDFNKESFNGASASADEVVGACNMLPFMSEKRLVVVKDLDKAGKGLTDALVDYLANPSETTVLACTAAKLAKNTRIYKAFAKLDKKAVVSCEPKAKRDLPAQVQDFARSHSVDITPRAAAQLVDMVGESTVHLDTEIRKMAAALGRGAVIDLPELERFVTATAEVKPWELVDALCERDATRALSLYARMPAQSVFGLLTMCVNRLRELLVAKELGGGSALAAALGMPDWRVRNHGRWASRFTEAELEHALVSAADLELAMKSGADQQSSFTRWVLELCTPSR
ncbi:MAG: DNA polymerase III subunit delta [Coriobacteriaceae bacterium]|nr:DNA polymerase III subunit delta [Coriobacteriaceae bacterium]MDD6768536.1 DNA polymerase III subunit delta [Coriobacteriaceae bacterium]